jgi:hypothetical protein
MLDCRYFSSIYVKDAELFSKTKNNLIDYLFFCLEAYLMSFLVNKDAISPSQNLKSML